MLESNKTEDLPEDNPIVSLDFSLFVGRFALHPQVNYSVVVEKESLEDFTRRGQSISAFFALDCPLDAEGAFFVFKTGHYAIR